MATSLACCMLTIMGIKAQSEGFDLVEARAEVTKNMQVSPRRISAIEVHISLRQNCKDELMKELEEKAKNCPVALSLHPNILQKVYFTWKT